MLIANYYIKPSYLIIFFVLLLILFIVKFITKLFIKSILILIVIGIGVYSNNYFSTANIKKFSEKLNEITNLNIDYTKIKDLYDSGEIIPDGNDIKIKFDDVWVNVNKIKDSVQKKDGKYFITIEGKEIEVKSDKILEILQGVEK